MIKKKRENSKGEYEQIRKELDAPRTEQETHFCCMFYMKGPRRKGNKSKENDEEEYARGEKWGTDWGG